MPKSCSLKGYACGAVGDGCGNIQNCANVCGGTQ